MTFSFVNMKRSQQNAHIYIKNNVEVSYFALPICLICKFLLILRPKDKNLLKIQGEVHNRNMLCIINA